MTGQFFKAPWTLSRLQEGPLGPHVDGFATLLQERGYPRLTARYHIGQVGDLSRWMQRMRLGVGELNPEKIKEYFRQRKRRRRYRSGDAAAFKMLLEQLQIAGVVASQVPETIQTEQDCLVHAFEKYLVQERGLSSATLANYVPVVRQFLSERFGEGHLQLTGIRADDVTGFVTRHAHEGSPGRAKLMVTALRSFLRFARLRGDTNADLAGCVLSVADWRLTSLPKSLEPEQVESVLKRCDRQSALGRRDFAILLLLARLGLRAGEVVALTLDDLNWEAGEITIRGKGNRQNRLPLPQEVGKALVAYLKRGRPRCLTRRLFVTARAPVKGFSNSVAISTIVFRALKRARLDPPRKGAHLFRHSAATQMLRRGATLSEIGEILRHQRQDTTAIYAKVDLARLRTIALPWPGGSL